MLKHVSQRVFDAGEALAAADREVDMCSYGLRRARSIAWIAGIEHYQERLPGAQRERDVAFAALQEAYRERREQPDPDPARVDREGE